MPGGATSKDSKIRPVQGQLGPKTVWPWTSHLPSLNLCFLICELDDTFVPLLGCKKHSNK